MNGSMGLVFDWRISIGTIIEIATIFFGGLFFLYGMKSRIDLMSIELAALKAAIAKLSEILTRLAVQDQRLLNIENDIKDMRHGVGFIVRPAI